MTGYGFAGRLRAIQAQIELHRAAIVRLEAERDGLLVQIDSPTTIDRAADRLLDRMAEDHVGDRWDFQS